MLDLMVDLVVDAVTRPSPITAGAMMHLIDCYCGSGLFCICSSLHFDVCAGIEDNEMAISDARENAASNSIRNCNFMAASANEYSRARCPLLSAVQSRTAKRRTATTTKRRVVACHWGISSGIRRWFWLARHARGACWSSLIS